MKICTRCKIEKDLSEFYEKSDRPGQTTSQCKSCKSLYSRLYRKQYPERYKVTRYKSDIKRLYGFTIEEYNEQKEIQKDSCLICKRVPEGKLVVDHEEGQGVRGLLCRQCNAAIGLLGHSVDTLHRAIEYLENPPLRVSPLAQIETSTRF